METELIKEYLLENISEKDLVSQKVPQLCSLCRPRGIPFKDRPKDALIQSLMDWKGNPCGLKHYAMLRHHHNGRAMLDRTDEYRLVGMTVTRFRGLEKEELQRLMKDRELESGAKTREELIKELLAFKAISDKKSRLLPFLKFIKVYPFSPEEEPAASSSTKRTSKRIQKRKEPPKKVPTPQEVKLARDQANEARRAAIPSWDFDALDNERKRSTLSTLIDGLPTKKPFYGPRFGNMPHLFFGGSHGDDGDSNSDSDSFRRHMSHILYGPPDSDSDSDLDQYNDSESSSVPSF